MNKYLLSVTVLLAALALTAKPSQTQTLTPDARLTAFDSDHDGINDEIERALLEKFLPTFMVSSNDCSIQPAQFSAQAETPTVIADNGSIYGQAFPRKQHPGEVELHYYHLWRRDCGEMGHRLDAEHVSALVSRGTNGGDWEATYWYAAAHEDTICDASQITRAETIHAQHRGATVWISQGKHASFLSELLCSNGCGGDRCERMKVLNVRQIINVGERGAPMNGIAWLGSPQWPLSDKLQRTDFLQARLARVQKLPPTDISWANPSKRPAQATILGAQAGIGGAATGARATNTALVVANSNTSTTLGMTARETGHAVRSSARNVWRALKKSAKNTGQVLDGRSSAGEKR